MLGRPIGLIEDIEEEVGYCDGDGDGDKVVSNIMRMRSPVVLPVTVFCDWENRFLATTCFGRN